MTERDSLQLDRRQALSCMVWAGTGVVWTVAGGVPASRLIGEAAAEEGGFSFVQISDSHIGFDKPANPDTRATLEAALDQGHGPAPSAGVHDPYRRRHPYGDAAAVRRRGAVDRPGASRRALRPWRARHPRPRDPRRLSRSLRQGRDRRRLVRVRFRRRPLCRPGQRRRPQGERPRLARPGATRLARRRPRRQDQFDADRRLRPYPACGRSRRNGDGERRIRPRR